jgi:hypothetical protein
MEGLMDDIALAKRSGGLRVRARLLPDPPLWCWEIIDHSGGLVASSWQSASEAFDSPGEALRRAAPVLHALSGQPAA